jgi:kynurenine formamidase
MIGNIGIDTVEPEKATFEVNIISSTKEKIIRVRVQVLVPPAWEEAEDSTWKDYELVRKATSDWEQELKITGLQKDLLSENIYAFIRLTDDDKKPTESWLTREVIVVFPPEKNLELVGTAPKVMFKLQKRTSKPIQP